MLYAETADCQKSVVVACTSLVYSSRPHRWRNGFRRGGRTERVPRLVQNRYLRLDRRCLSLALSLGGCVAHSPGTSKPDDVVRVLATHGQNRYFGIHGRADPPALGYFGLFFLHRPRESRNSQTPRPERNGEAGYNCCLALRERRSGAFGTCAEKYRARQFSPKCAYLSPSCVSRRA